MRNTFLKVVCLLTSLLVFFSVLTGCAGQNQDQGGVSTSVSNSVSTASEVQQQEGLPKNGIKYEPEVTLTTVRAVGDDVKFKNGETIDNNVFNTWLKNELGINLKYLWTTPTTNDAFQTKLMLSLSAGEQLPDFISIPGNDPKTGVDAQQLIDSGKFQPVGDLFDKYASPVWKKAMDQVPNAWMPYIRDGKKYAIPEIDYIMQHDDCMWIRQDWLDKLGLKAPKTIDELEQVMDAFVNRDPDGDNKADTYGMTTALSTNYNAWIGTGEIFGAFGAIPQKWQKDASGNIVYGSVRPEIKPTLAKLKDWIDKGYLPKEVGIFDEMKASEVFTSGKAGIAFGPQWVYSWPLMDTETNIKGAKVWPYPLPAGPDGKIGQASEGTHYMVILLNKDLKNPEVFFTYMNYLYDNWNDPKDGSEFQYGFAKGYDYDIVDGKPVYSDKEIPGGFVDPQKYFPTLPPRVPSFYIDTLSNLANGKTPVTPYEKKQATACSKQDLESAKIIVSQHQYTIDDLFTGKPTATMKDKMPNLNKMETQTFSEILYGKVGIDAFDKFVSDWYAAGGRQITQEVSDWYKSVGGK